MRARHRGEAGFSLMEMLMVVAVSGVILIIAYQVLEESYRTAMSLEARNELNIIAQRPANAVQTAIYQARTIFDNDAGGVAASYYSRIVSQLPANAVPAPGTLLPNLAPSAVLTEDVIGTRYVGNCLLIARQMPPIFVNYDHDSNAGTANVPFPIDRFRFEMFYLRQCDKTVAARACAGTRRGFGGNNTAVNGTNFVYDLMRVRTIDFADYFELSPLINNDPTTGGSATPPFTAAQRLQIATGLAAAGLTRAWNPTPGTLATAAFYTVTTSGTNAGRMTLQPTPTLNLYANPASVNAEILRGASITGAIEYSMAFRKPNETEATSTPLKDQPANQDGQFSFSSRMSSLAGSNAVVSILRVPRFAANDVVTTTFPSGFEVKIGGVGAGQRVLVRSMVMARYASSRFDAQESIIIAAKGLSL